VLVAVIILLFGVIVALRIFPRGFDAFTETQQTTTSYTLMDAWVKQFQEQPELLGDFYPLGDTGSAAAAAAADTFDFHDITAVQYEVGATDNAFAWYHQHLYPSIWRNADGTVQLAPEWPLGQPLSARVLRKCEGEKVPIPAGRAADILDGKAMPDLVDGVLATVTAPASIGESELQVDDATKLLHGMWLAIDLNPADQKKMDMLVQVDIGATKLIGSSPVANPVALYVSKSDQAKGLGAIRMPIPAGAVLRQFAPASFVPKYLPRFGPILPNGTLDVVGKKIALAQIMIQQDGAEVQEDAPVTIYDTRYRHVSRDERERLLDRISALPDSLYYSLEQLPAAPNTLSIVLLPQYDAERCVRFSCFVRSDPATMEFLPPQMLLLPRNPDPDEPDPTKRTITWNATLYNQDQSGSYPVSVTATADRTAITFTAATPLAGSELINRAYRNFADAANPETIQADEDPTSAAFPAPSDAQYATKLRTYYTKLGAMPAGYYYFPRMDEATLAGGAVPGTIYFSPRDRGRTVKLDYTIADWGALHEDLTLNDEGYMTLALPDPKIANRPTGPRERTTWGLYGPMQEDGRDVMLALVDTRTDMVYHVVKRDDRAHPYGVEPSSGVVVPAQVIAVDLSQAAAGRVRLGGVPAGVVWRGPWGDGGAYTKNDGVTHYGLPYRCLQDHTAAPANRPHPDGTTAQWELIENPAWDALKGNTFRVYYRARRDWTLQVFKAPSVFWMMSPSATKTALAGRNLQWRAASWCAETVTDPTDPTKSVTAGWLAVPGVYEGQSVAVDYYHQVTDGDGTTALRRVSGEVHPVPKRGSGKPNSLIRLAHPPAPNTKVTVRGITVTVRALWIQPRGGAANRYTTSPTAPEKQPLNERWQAKTVTVTLPEFK